MRRTSSGRDKIESGEPFWARWKPGVAVLYNWGVAVARPSRCQDSELGVCSTKLAGGSMKQARREGGGGVYPALAVLAGGCLLALAPGGKEGVLIAERGVFFVFQIRDGMATFQFSVCLNLF